MVLDIRQIMLPDELKDLMVIKAKVAGVHLVFTAPEDIILKVYNDDGIEKAKEFVLEIRKQLLTAIESVDDE